MKSYNLTYFSNLELEKFINNNRLRKENNLLIQIFSGVIDLEKIKDLLNYLKRELPKARIIGTTTDGEIVNGLVKIQSIVISFTVFENTNIKLFSSPLVNNKSFDTGKYLAKKFIVDDTKVVILFSDGLNTNGEDLLKGIESINNKVVVAGGMAGDNGIFEKTFVFTNNEILDSGVVGVGLQNKDLIVNTKYSFNWKNIGKRLLVTKSDKNRVYTIDGINAVDVYSKYLGEDIAKKLPSIGIEFPLVIHRNGNIVARTIQKAHEDGSLTFAGNINEGEMVQFAFGNAQMILDASAVISNDLLKLPIQSIFVYSSMTRRRFMPAFVGLEIKPLQEMYDTCGYFASGEFFHSSKQNELLNETMTLLCLSESKIKKIKNKAMEFASIDIEQLEILKGLTTLIDVTSNEIEEINISLEKEIYQRLEAEELLIKKLEIERIVATISGNFVNVENIDESIDITLEMLGKFSNVGRAYLFQLDFDKDVMSNTHERCRQGVIPQIQNLQDIPIKSMPWWMEKLIKKQIIHIPNVQEMKLKKSMEYVRQRLKAQQIHALLAFPLYIKNELIGFIGFDKVEKSHNWEQDDIKILNLASEILGNALARQRIRQKLRKSEQKNRLIYNMAPTGIGFVDNETNIIQDANPALHMMLEVDEGKLIGKKTTDFFLNKEDFTNYKKNITNQGKVTGHEVFIKTQKGNKKIFLLSSKLEKKSNKRFFTIIDITELKKVQNDLEKSKKIFWQLFDYQMSGIILYRPIDDGKDFVVLDLNKSAEKIDKVKRKDVVGKKITEVYPKAKKYGIIDVIRQVYKSGNSQYIPTVYYDDGRLDGWLEKFIYKLPTGEVASIFNNISERKKAEKKLQKSEAESRAVLNHIPTGIGIVDVKTGNIEQANPKLCEVMEGSNQDLIGQKAINYFEDNEQLKKYVSELKKYGEVKGMKIKIKTLKGNIKIVLATSKYDKITNKRYFSLIDIANII